MEKFYDAIIVGGGPAGLSAAIYLARAQYHVLVIEKEKIGGQITITSEVVNYPGVQVASGHELTEAMRIQAENFGAEFMLAEVNDLELTEDKKTVRTSKGVFETLGVVLATGANPRKLGFQGEREFQGRGVAYCATCDGEFFTGMDVFVIGGGFAAAEESIFLTKYAKKVHIIVREEDFTCAGSIVDEVLKHPKIEVSYETEIIEAGGNGVLEYAMFRNNKTGDIWKYVAETGNTFGIFVFAGYVPANQLFINKIELNEGGYLITDQNRKTSMDGVYGAGDVCVKNLRQVVTAVADGAIAATSLEKHISTLYEKLNLPKHEKPVKKHVINEKKVETGSMDNGKEADVSTVDYLEEAKYFTETMKQQLLDLFNKFEEPIVLKGYLDEQEISKEVEGFLQELTSMTDKIICRTITIEEEDKVQSIQKREIIFPSIDICNGVGEYLGASFHGVPGGHEINSFLITLYNAAGPGQSIEKEDFERLKSLDKEVKIDIGVTLSCSVCPELVMTAMLAAVKSDKIRTEVFDISHYPKMKEKYHIMSVPCMIINEKEVYFGKKSLSELLEILEKTEQEQ